ncbi:MAG: hypothetical protein ABSH28_05190 [Acidobacteriota bacterium]|jgi:hypothetical protein
MSKQIVGFRLWCLATIEERMEWLQNGVEIEEAGRRILDWAFAFKDAGAIISTEQMLEVYDKQIAAGRTS